MQIAAQHTEAVSQRAGMSVEEWLLLDGIALHSGGVSPRHVEGSAAVVADFADAGLTFGNGAAMTAGETADAVAFEFFVERGLRFADLLVEDVAEGGHGSAVIILEERRTK